MRDRRFDHLYDKGRRPVKEFVLERFAEVLAEELRQWPHAHLAWSSEAERARWEAATAERPREEVVRLALEMARLDLRHQYDQAEALLARQAHRLLGGTEEAAARLLSRTASEACLELLERADRMRLSREDLVAALQAVERRMFRVTLG
ncbi:MAG TPA: hypothetical protein VMU15_16075 [Anaeromyxobacter sp.]|nr:hypothetical protein [Anaeromyxobacter sp.]